MNVIDVITLNDKVLLYCTGNDIPVGFSCREINIQGNNYHVIHSSTYKSISDQVVALIQIDVNPGKLIPLGRVAIVE